MKWCPACKKPIRDEDVVREPERSEEEQRSLESFSAQLPGGRVPAKPEVKEYHMRAETQGQRRKGVVGGWRTIRVRCGPLREATRVELASYLFRE